MQHASMPYAQQTHHMPNNPKKNHTDGVPPTLQECNRGLRATEGSLLTRHTSSQLPRTNTT